MNEKKTLKIRAPSAQDNPSLPKKGRGWEISEKRLDALHERARDMRRHSSEAHKALAARFAKADLGRYTFKRHAVVGSAILDFNCHNLGMAIAINEDVGESNVPDPIATRRDKSLEAVGVRVMRIPASDILQNMDAVLRRITAGMRMRIADKQKARRDHHANHPRQSAPRGRNDRKNNAQDR